MGWHCVDAGNRLEFSQAHSIPLKRMCMSIATGGRFWAGLLLLFLPGLSCPAQSILREYWTNITGNSVADLTTSPDYPNNPVERTYPTLFEAPVNYGEYYGTRMRGYLIPPQTGNYLFWIASDNSSQLWLSTNDLPDGKRLIAQVNSYTGSRQWTKETNQQSAPITLVGGQRYYVEALQVEGTGGDNLAVGWRLPSGADDRPISGQYLAPWVVSSNPPSILEQPLSLTVQEYSPASFRVVATGGEPLRYQWQENERNLDGEISATLLFYRIAPEDNGATYRCIISNPFGVVTSQVATLTVTPDQTPPRLLRQHPPPNVVVRALTQAEVWFDEPVLGVRAEDLLINGQPATNVTGLASGPYVFQFPAPATGTVAFTWSASHSISDYSINTNRFAGGDWTVTLAPDTAPGDVIINEFLAANENGLVDEDGENEGWIELFNRGSNGVNLAGWSLTDDPAQPGQWTFPATNLGPGEYLVVFASGKDRLAPAPGNRFHTNFKLANGGEYLGLFTPDSPRVAASELTPGYPAQRNDTAYGWDAGGQWRHFLTPSPGAPNSGLTATGWVAEPHFSVRRGFFNTSFNLQLTCATPGATIRYTTDGRPPTEYSGNLYTGKITISSSTILRAAAFQAGQLPSRVVTHSYFFSQPPSITSLPVLSLVTAEENLTGPTGIMGIGGGTYSNGVWTAVNAGDYFNPTQHGIAWERPVSAEYIQPADNGGFQIDCGLRVQGSDYTRPRYTTSSKFSFRLYFRGDYGEGQLHYPLFGDAVPQFNQLSLRAGHNDMTNPFLKDELMRRLGRDMGQVNLRGNFVNLFINGVYKGYYNPTERCEEGFFKNWYGGEAWDVITIRSEAQEGDNLDFNAMRSFVAANDQRVPANYAATARWLDLTNFVDYLLVNIYGATRDWPHNNWRAARERRAGALWRFYLWDAEGAFGTFSQPVTESTFTNALVSGTAEIPRLYQALVKSPEFRLLFADRIQKHLFNQGALTDSNIVAHFVRMQTELSGVIPSMNTSILTTWVPQRRPVILADFPVYELGAFTNAPSFNVHGGRVASGFNLTMTTLAGTIYYTTNGTDPRVPFTGAVAPEARLYTGPVTLTRSSSVNARALIGTNWSAVTSADFSVGALGLPLRITEIMAEPPGGGAFEYVELQNTGTLAMDVGNLSFEGIDFKFPPNTWLGPGEFMVLASGASPAEFAIRYPAVQVAGWFGGSLRNEGERLALIDINGNTVCSVTYGRGNGWPIQAGGGGYSLELASLDLDPNSPASWRASRALGGSPGAANPPQPAPLVRLNEVMAWNAGSVTNDATTPDWAELHNPGPDRVVLDGWRLIEGGNSNSFVFPPGTWIEAGGFLMVWCDTNTAASGLHTGFALDREGEAMVLEDPDSNRVDAVAFGAQLADYTIGRDAAGDWILCVPSPLATNIPAATAPVTTLFINEWLANAPAGRADWIELYNRSPNLPAPLQGIYLATSNDLYQLRSLSFVAGGGHIQLRADEQPAPDHLDFKLPAGGGAISLHAPSGLLIQKVVYGAQADGVSSGSLPDGTTSVVNFTASQSPGQANYLVATNGLFINEVMARNTAWRTNDAGHYADWIELFNSTVNPIALTGMSLSLDRAEPGQWRFPAGAILPAGGYLQIWCDPLAPATLSNTPPFNTGRGLDCESGGVYLFNASNQVADRIEFGFQVPNQTIGRTASGWRLLATPTPAATNSTAATLGAVTNLRINEWAANPTVGDDWVEIYNLSTQAVELSGLYLTDDPSLAGRTRFQFAPLSFIASNGFVQVIADGQPEKGRQHADFALDAQGEMLRLCQSNFTVIDSVDTTVAPGGFTEGRNPDGSSAGFWQTSVATPGASNVIVYPLTIIAQPASVTTLATSNVAFSVTAWGTGKLRYQWRFEGTNLPGATNATLILSGVSSNHQGVYQVTISDDLATLDSNPATLTVRYRVSFLKHPASQIVMAGSNLTLSVEVIGTRPLTYKWRQNAYYFATNTDWPTITVTNIQGTNAGYYVAVVTNAVTSGASSQVAYVGVVTAFPTNLIVLPGTNVTLRVAATGPQAFAYQWRFNGTLLEGQTNTTLTLTNVADQHDGRYTVDVMTASAQATTPPASLSVLRPITLSRVRWAEGRLTLDVDGNARLRYDLEASADLTNWTTVASFLNTNPLGTVELPPATNAPLRFYRVRLGQ